MDDAKSGYPSWNKKMILSGNCFLLSASFILKLILAGLTIQKHKTSIDWMMVCVFFNLLNFFWAVLGSWQNQEEGTEIS